MRLRAWLFLACMMNAIPAGAATRHEPGTIELSTVTVRGPDGKSVRVDMGTLFVPENRRVPSTRVVSIGFARVHGAPGSGSTPVFVLPGGPGRSYLNAFTDTDEPARERLSELLDYTAAGDVVVVDQRGYSRRGDILEVTAAPLPLDQPRTLEAEAASMKTLAAAAVSAYPGKDLSGYSIIDLAHDVDDLRAALGYRRIALSGQSFGSQWAFAVMRTYPESVSRAVLSGVEPLNAAYDMPSQIWASFQRIASEADQDAGLAPYLPSGGLMAAVDAIVERIARADVHVLVTDPASGQQVTVTMGTEDLQAAMLQPAADWPAYVLSIYHGHYQEWALDTLGRRRNSEGAVRLIEPLIDASLGVSRLRGKLLYSDPARRYLGVGDFDALIRSRTAWPTADVGDALRLPVASDIPVLFIHGDWDTSTPIDNTLGSLPYFRHGVALLVHRGTHHSREPLFAASPAIRDSVMRFLRTGVTHGLPTVAELQSPAFRRPAFPPPQ